MRGQAIWFVFAIVVVVLGVLSVLTADRYYRISNWLFATFLLLVMVLVTGSVVFFIWSGA